MKGQKSRLLYLGLILTIAAVSANISVPKARIVELFEEPVRFYGFTISFGATSSGVWYEYLRW